MVLKRLKEDAESFLGEPVEEAVISLADRVLEVNVSIPQVNVNRQI